MSYHDSSSLALNYNSSRNTSHLQHSYRPPQQQDQLPPSSLAADNYYSPSLVPVTTGTFFDGYYCPDFVFCENQEIVQPPDAQQHCHHGDSSATVVTGATNPTTLAAAAAHDAALMCDLEMLREATTTTTPTADKLSRAANSLPACAGGGVEVEPKQGWMNYPYCELIVARDPIVISNHGAEGQDEARQHCDALATTTISIPRDTSVLPPRPPKTIVHETTKRPRPAGQQDQRRRVKQKDKVEALMRENVLLKQKVTEIAEKTSQLEKKVPPLSKRERSELEALRVMKQRVKSLFGC
jgi:hypothetical protein